MENKKLNIVIGDDQIMFAQGLVNFLEDDFFSIQAILSDYATIREDIKKYPVDLLLLDINFGSGKNAIHLIKKLKEENDCMIVMLSSHNSNYIKTEALKQGADGFIDKYQDLNELKSILKGYMRKEIKDEKTVIDGVNLTEREKEILVLLYHGMSEKEIADKLFICKTTVKTHKKHLFQKLKVQKQSELIKNCIEQGILIV